MLWRVIWNSFTVVALISIVAIVAAWIAQTMGWGTLLVAGTQYSNPPRNIYIYGLAIGSYSLPYAAVLAFGIWLPMLWVVLWLVRWLAYKPPITTPPAAA